MNTRVALVGCSVSKTILFGILVGLALTVNSFASATPCAVDSENRQLDYWLGNWKIGSQGSSGNARSTVTLSLDKCLVVENWNGGRGHHGQNIFGYSVEDRSWYGFFADNEGRVHVFTFGKVSSGSAEFEGPSRDQKAGTVLNRVKVTKLGPNKVEQTWEKSTDNGSTWNMVFRGEYSRANP